MFICVAHEIGGIYIGQSVKKIGRKNGERYVRKNISFIKKQNNC